MPNRSLSDLAPNERRERVTALIGIGVRRVLEQKWKNSPEFFKDMHR